MPKPKAKSGAPGRRGRPTGFSPYGGETMIKKTKSFSLPAEQWDWLEGHPNQSQAIRDLIAKEMAESAPRPNCPRCQSSCINKAGHQDGRQKYYCGGCGRHFLEKPVAQQGRSDNGLTFTYFLTEEEVKQLESANTEWSPCSNEVVVPSLMSFEELRSQVESDGDSLVQV